MHTKSQTPKKKKKHTKNNPTTTNNNNNTENEQTNTNNYKCLRCDNSYSYHDNGYYFALLFLSLPDSI